MRYEPTRARTPRFRISVILTLLVFCTFELFVGQEVAAQTRQSTTSRAERAIRRLESQAGPGMHVTRSTLTSLADFASSERAVRVPEGSGDSAEARVRSFIREHGDAFGIADASQLQVMNVSGSDAVGMEHVRLRQLHRGIPVTGAELTVHLKANGVAAVCARTLPDLDDVETSPSVSPSAALAAARVLMEERFGLTNSQYSMPRLEVFNRGLLDGSPNPTRLAWFVEARHTDRRQFIWVDAQQGAVLLHFNQFTDALNRTIYSSEHSFTLPGTTARREGEPESGDQDVDLAYKYAGDAYQFFLTQFGRDGYDDHGSPMISSVHYRSSYQNASWNGEEVAFGDSFSWADDVVAHEWIHAVTENTAGLFYYLQSGALNESFSDIFGETIDLLNGSGNDSTEVRWLQGEDVPGGPFRNLMDPPALKQPGKMSDSEFFLCYGSLNEDQGGVHVNSGILNHAYALMVDGGSYNGYTIHGIGLLKAAQIMYRSLAFYLGAGSNFMDAYNAINQSANDLVGTMGITASEVNEVKKALDAVELSSPWPCGLPEPSIPALTPAGSVPLTILSDELEDIHSELWTTRTLWGLNHWSGGEGTQGLYWTGFGRSGGYHFWGSSRSYLAESSSAVEMTRDIRIPPNSRMQFSHSFGFQRDGTNFLDAGVVEFSLDGGLSWKDAGSSIVAGTGYNGTFQRGKPAQTYPAFVGTSHGYTASQLDLGVFAGKSVRFRFRMDTLVSNPFYQDYGWFIDDIHIYQVAPDLTLLVSTDGAGSGKVVSTPAGIQCGSQCGRTFPRSTMVTLTATPDTNATFAGWRGDCSGTGRCNVAMTGAKYVVAEFSPRSCQIALSPATVPFGPQGGDGSVSVQSPAGCGWTATVDPPAPWITLSSGNLGSSPESVHIHVEPNEYAGSRRGTIRIGSQSISIVQGASTGWTNLGPEGGIVYSLASSPANTNILYAGTSQGVYRSANRGESWNRMNEGLTLLEALSLAVDPNNSQIVYVAIHGAGVFKSIDGGAHWVLSITGIEGTDARYVSTIAIDPQDTSRILIGGAALYISGDAGDHWVRPNRQSSIGAVSISIYPRNSNIIYVSTGLVYRSDSGGAGWIPCYSGPYPGYSSGVVAVHPSNPDTVLAARYPSGIQRSIDGGSTWQVSNGDPASMVVALTFDRLDPETVYAGTSGDGIYKSIDGGITWGPVGNRSPHGYINDILIKPGSSSTLYTATYGRGVFISESAGQDWRPDNRGLQSIHVRAVRVDPKNHAILYIGTEGGIFKSQDNGLTWQARNEGLTERDVLSLAIRPDNPDVVFAGTRNSKVFRSIDGGLHWAVTHIPSGPIGGNVLNIVIDPSAPVRMYASDSHTLFKSTDAGLTWASVGEYCDRSVTLDPSNSQVVYSAGYFSLHTSSDGGSHWKMSARGLPQNLYADVLVPDALQPKTFYLSNHWDATLYRSTDGGENWGAINDGSPGIPFVAITQDSSGALFGATSGAGVLQSRDAGRHWTDTNEGLTNLTIGDLVADPVTPGLIYAGTTGSGVARRYFDPPCEAGISPGSAGYGSAGGNGSISIDIGENCTWSAVSSDSWILIESAVSGRGTGNIIYHVAPNPVAQSRSGTISVAGWSFGVVQAGTILTLSPSGIPEAIAGASYQQDFKAAGGTEPYTYRISLGVLPQGLSLSASGLLAGAPAQPGRFDFSITATDTLNQSTLWSYSLVIRNACGYRLGSSVSTMKAQGGVGSVTLNTADNCPWTVQSDPGAGWISLTNGAGNGSGVIRFLILANQSSRSRSASLKIADQSLRVVQQGANQWTSLGPDNSQVRDLKIVASDPATLYAGTARGIFKSGDYGEHWVALTPAAAAVTDSVAVDPNDPRIIYATQRDSLLKSRNGLLKSVDGGRTWRSIENGLPLQTYPGIIAINPHDTNTLFLTGLDGFYKSSDGGESWGSLHHVSSCLVYHIIFDPVNTGVVYLATSEGLFKSDDSGDSWRRLNLPCPYPGDVAAFHLALDPVDPKVLYIASSYGLYKSTDGGETVYSLDDDLGHLRILSVAVSPANRRLVFAVEEGQGLFVSRDGGDYWTWATEKSINWEDADYATGVVVAGDPVNPDLIYAGSASGLSVSRDGGRTWSAMNAGLPRSFVNTVRVHPRDSNVVFAGTTFDGLYRSEDGGSTWQNVLWTEGAQTVFTVVFHPDKPDIMYIGTSAGAYRSRDGGRSWDTFPPSIQGSPYAIHSILVDPVEPNRIYFGTFGGGVIKSIDGGLSWQIASPELEGSFSINSLEIEPGNHNVVYASSWHGVYRSNDSGLTWQAVNQGLTDLRVNCLAIDPGNRQILYAGTANLGAFRSADGGKSWQTVNSGLTDTQITALETHPLFPNLIYAATGSHGVYMSTDGGNSWSLFDEGPAGLRVLSVEIDPSDAAALFIGTEGGGIYRMEGDDLARRSGR